MDQVQTPVLPQAEESADLRGRSGLSQPIQVDPAKKRRRSITKGDRETFLEGLRKGWSVTASAKATGHPRQDFYKLRDDEAFAEAWAAALDEGCDVLEQTAFEIATQGALEEVRNASGNLVSTRRRQDPATVRFLLAAHRPGVYSERSRVELSGTLNTEPLQHQTRLSLRDVVELAHKLGLDRQDEALPPPLLALPAAREEEA